MPVSKTIVISLGGSIMAPDEIQTEFLKNFRSFILKFLKKNYRFIIVTGGGGVSRKYQKSADEITKISDKDKDLIGIQATKLNAQLLLSVFRNVAFPEILDDPKKIIKNNFDLYIASGWKPGSSSDFMSVVLAKRFNAKIVINASNILGVFRNGDEAHKNTKPFEELDWVAYRKLVGAVWKPGMHAPFDPVASRFAQKHKMEVIITKGTDLKNLENILKGKKSSGTVIRP